MQMSARKSITAESLRRVHDRESLLLFLREELNWPIAPDSYIACNSRSESTKIHSLLPFNVTDPFDVILVECEGDMHRYELLEMLAEIHRTGTSTHSASNETVIICSSSNYRIIRFAYLNDEDRFRPKLSVFVWDRDASFGTRSLREHSLSMLMIPTGESAPSIGWLKAWDVERVANSFFKECKKLFESAESKISGVAGENGKRLFTHKLFNFLLFERFIEGRGWITFNGRHDALRTLWEEYEENRTPDSNFYAEYLKIHLSPCEQGTGGTAKIHRCGSQMSDIDLGAAYTGVHVPDEVIEQLLKDLLYSYNFTTMESTGDDVEVAVDPEMLGRVFEVLVASRHGSGSYYTPKPVVSFMCREALRGYLQISLPGMPEQVLDHLLEHRDLSGLSDPEAVLASLRSVKICDPACGSGAYLMGMFHELLALRYCLMQVEHSDVKSKYERELEIIGSNLYGMDLDPIAVDIACMRLWLSTVDQFEDDKPESLPKSNLKVKHGDSLASTDAASADSPEILGRGGFDIVITNPPYLSTKHGFGKEDREVLEKRFMLAKGHFDAYALFVESGIHMLVPGGTYSYIIPKSALSNSNMRPMRELIASWRLLAIADPGQVFTARIEPVIIVGQKRRPSKETIRVFINRISDGMPIMPEQRSLSDVITPTGVWNICTNSVSADKFGSYLRFPEFGDFFSITRGEECGKHAGCILASPEPGAYSLLRGMDIQSYSIAFAGYYIRRDDDDLKYKPISLYAGTKLLIRRVSNNLVAAVDFGEHHVLNTVYIARPKPGCSISIEYACALLNSRIMNDYFHTAYVNDDHLFPYVRKEQLENLPVALPTPEEEYKIVSLLSKLSSDEREPDGGIADTRASINALVQSVYDRQTLSLRNQLTVNNGYDVN